MHLEVKISAKKKRKLHFFLCLGAGSETEEEKMQTDFEGFQVLQCNFILMGKKS